MASVNTDKLVAGLAKYFEIGTMAELLERAKIDFWGEMLHGGAQEIIRFAVRSVEKLAADLGSVEGKEKEDAVVNWLDDCIDLPGILDGKPVDADGRFIRPLVRAGVKFYNDKFGHVWPKNGGSHETVESTAGAGPAVVDPDNGTGSGTAD